LEEGENGGIVAYIYTENLNITSVTKQDSDEYFQYLYSDSDIMKTMRDGLVKNQEWTENKIADWVKRWENNIPFSGMKITSNTTDEFIGHISAGFSSTPNSSELSYMVKKDKQNQGYGYEAAGAIVFEYCPLLKYKHYKPNEKDTAFSHIVAIARTTNIPSNNIITKLGFDRKYEFVELDATRYYYSQEVPIFDCTTKLCSNQSSLSSIDEIHETIFSDTQQPCLQIEDDYKFINIDNSIIGDNYDFYC